MSEYHEPVADLPAETRDYHRALQSLVEEIEAVNWYQQRIAAAPDDALARILQHNRDEEIEHACMLLEWLRRHMPGWDERLQTYLFTKIDITAVEAQQAARSGAVSLNIGSLKGASIYSGTAPDGNDNEPQSAQRTQRNQ